MNGKSNAIPVIFYTVFRCSATTGWNASCTVIKNSPGRWMQSLYVAKEILCCKTPYDILYGTSFRGLELIILLRSLHLYRKPIVIWHHTAIIRSTSTWKEYLSRFFYRGIDRMFFFSKQLIKDSLRCGKASEERLKLIHWGPDLAFYDNILKDIRQEGTTPSGFISTGKENRDIRTLVCAFSEAQYPLDVYTTKRFGNVNYEDIVRKHSLSPLTKVHFTGGIRPYDFALRSGTKELCGHLLSRFSLHRRTDHISGSHGTGYARHQQPEPEL